MALAVGGCGLTFDLGPLDNTGGLDASAPADASPRGDADPRDASRPEAGVTDGSAAPDAFSAPDAGPCDETPCSLLQQCGCLAGEGCYPVGSDVLCEPAGSTPPGGGCTDESECVTGASCLVVSGSSTGVCQAFCGDDGWCVADSHCIAVFSRLSRPVGACSLQCDPIGMSGCPSGLACTLSAQVRVPDGVTVLIAACVPPGSRPAGSPCLTGQCAPGVLCVSGMCARICDLDAPACAGGEICRSILGDPVSLGRRLGSCYFTG